MIQTTAHPPTVSALWRSWQSGPFYEEWCFAVNQEGRKDFFLINILHIKRETMNKNLKYAHLMDFIEWNADGNDWDNEYTGSISIVFINNPQGDAAQLENVEWIENLKKHIKWI